MALFYLDYIINSFLYLYHFKEQIKLLCISIFLFNICKDLIRYKKIYKIKEKKVFYLTMTNIN
jgi:hypothetical protein